MDDIKLSPDATSDDSTPLAAIIPFPVRAAAGPPPGFLLNPAATRQLVERMISQGLARRGPSVAKQKRAKETRPRQVSAEPPIRPDQP